MSDEPKVDFVVNGLIGVQPKIIDTPNDFVFYTNTAVTQVSAEEFVIQFGLINAADPEQSPSIARAYMTPAHAKRLLIVLSSVIERYEQNFGTIAANPDDLFTPEARKRLGLPEK